MAHEKKTEQVLAAALKVFLRYGFRRVTMGDLAEAAQMSRPALYLVFPSKEHIFTEAITYALEKSLDEIRQSLPGHKTVAEQMAFAFEVWCVRPFELIQASPDAADLLESSYEFAAQAMSRAEADFEELLAKLLEPILARKKTKSTLTPLRIARILRTSAIGLKKGARDSADLRQLIQELHAIVLSGL